MARRRNASSIDPWSRLALQTTRMMFASAEVIARRSARLALAGVAPRADDHAEFVGMGTEKAAAAMECAAAASRHALQASWWPAARAWQDAWGLGVDMALLAASATPSQALHRQARVMRRLTSGVAARDGASAMLALSNAVVAPLHRRATANAKRLRRIHR
jgi:hypothetical protein